MFGIDDGALAEGVFEVGGGGFFEVDFSHCSNASRGQTEVTTRWLRITSSANAGSKIDPESMWMERPPSIYNARGIILCLGA
jgi:hypothetical protein